ncbi:DNA-binding protein [Massilimicrobiota sp. An105]|uniref:ORF6N domain-containing protein n=1 Tax=Massilimicrobiota sp. An105 TaxID=1965540 RepID=UPI000B384895|nr:ORF6N domain-containing protein [Massilimicrobiota sp. An105]OUQ77094.1 DNA-binding protein [Massilimicrobiota sp. An105]
MATEDRKEVLSQNQIETPVVEIVQPAIEKLIYVIRDKQVMIDSDLAMLYQVETGALNRAVKRNIKRFPDDFRFQLTVEEYENLKCQIGISSLNENGYGGRRTLPYVFTEQGISMLASVLHSDIAINVSIGIMRAFVEMRRFIANNALLFEHISNVELKQLEYQKQTDEKLEQIFEYISEHEEASQKIFFDGQIYDAFSLIVSLIQKAEKEITLIDGYVDVGTLNLLAKKNEGVSVTVYTHQRTRLSNIDVANFNAQYPALEVKYTSVFHDRFLILDGKTAYHIGASLKDAGKKTFGITLINDESITKDILQRLELETEE